MSNEIAAAASTSQSRERSSPLSGVCGLSAIVGPIAETTVQAARTAAGTRRSPIPRLGVARAASTTAVTSAASTGAAAR